MRVMANAVRALAMDGVEAAKSGHPGMPMGMADVATVLFAKYLKFDASAPRWPDRDRFVLSAGHGSMLLYALLHLTGYADMPLDELRRFRQLHSKTPGHPEYGHTEGVETTTGPLGQGLATAVGMAMAEAHLRARFGAEACDHRTWVLAGDGCLMEGVSHEAIALAGKQRLNRLIVLWDDNEICIDGAVSLADTTDQRARFEAAGWTVLRCDGHDMADVDRAMATALQSDRPTMIACRTTIGFGAPKKAGTKSAHGEPLGAEELAAAKAALDWPHGPFEVPGDVAAQWRAVGARGAQARAEWEARVASSAWGPAFRAVVDDPAGGAVAALAAHAKAMAAEKPKLATRASSGAAIGAFWEPAPAILGGSADLTGSNLTYVKGSAIVTPETPEGRYIHYGVREFGMAAAMNGLALHGGVLPYGGTFLCFADYARPAIRLGALMGVRVIHVMTHDSIGLGEDGPTHQPVEHLASLRAMPNLCVFRPCDAVETAECWAAAIAQMSRPSVLVLSRQAVPTYRDSAEENLSLRGAYVLQEAEGGVAAVTLIATGTEVSVAVEARALLQKDGFPTRVVSAPSFELFREQDEAYRAGILGSGVRIGVEAAVAQGWRDAFDVHGFVGMSGFGASAPAPALYAHFGITPEGVVSLARRHIAAKAA